MTPTTTATAPATKPTPKFWEPGEGHESLTHDDFSRDKWTCLQQTQTTPVYFGSCMEAHGWVKEK
jgi:peptide subunit release factor RF-3